MKENKLRSTASYFRYQLINNHGKALLFITIFSVIIAFIVGVNGQPAKYYDYVESIDDYVVIDRFNSTIEFSVILLCFLCYIVPILLFSFFKNRRNLDYIYSMPISRTNVGIVHYVIGLILVIVPFTAAYLTNFFLLLSRQSDMLDLLPCLPFYFWCFLLGWIMYSLFTFAFNEANSTGDGCVFMILWTFVFAIIAEFIDLFNDTYILIPWMFMGELTSAYSYKIEKYESYYHDELLKEVNFMLIILIAVALLAMIYFLVAFGKRRTEKAEEVSDSSFGYRTLIPIYLIALVKLLNGSIGSMIFLTVACVVGYTIYRRGFKYKVSDYVVMGLMLGVCVFELIF